MKIALQRIDKFYHTPWIYIVSIGLVWIISFVFGILPFILNNNGVEWGWGPIADDGNHYIYRNTYNSWLGWTILGISLTGATLAVIGEIFVANNSRKYVFPIAIARFFTISFCILAKLWFLAFTSFLYALIGIINCKNWDDQGSHLVSKMTIKRHATATIITICFLAFGLGMTLGGENAIIEDSYPIMDVFFSTMVIIGWLNISQKNKWGWTVYIISDFGFITLYLLMGSMSFFASASVYLAFDCIAAFRWFNWEYTHYNLTDSLVEKYI